MTQSESVLTLVDLRRACSALLDEVERRFGHQVDFAQVPVDYYWSVDLAAAFDVSQGRRDGSPQLSRVRPALASKALSNHPWDMAGGTAIVREVGALVMDVDGSPHDLMSTATVATAPSLKDDVLQILRRVSP